MERQIGETFDAGNGITLEVRKQGVTATKKCNNCYYRITDGQYSDEVVSCGDVGNVGGECAGHFRKDKTSVIFKIKQSWTKDRKELRS